MAGLTRGRTENLSPDVAVMKSALPACDAPDELSDVAQHRRQNSQARRKGADQGEMTDPAITPFLDNTAMGVDLRCHSAAVVGTD